jgi:hypothetical protein
VALRRSDATLRTPLRVLPRVAVAAGAAVAAVALVRVPVVPDLGDVVVAAVVYAAAALALRAVPGELAHALLRR